MKKIILFTTLAALLAGCTTTSYKPDNAAPGISTAKDYPIPVYTEDEDVPRPCKVIGTIIIGHTMFTMFGGSIDKEMEQVMQLAHEKGADVVKEVSIQKPGFDTANFGVKANLLRYADDWETVNQTEKNFSDYLRQHQATLDPIEGIWSCGWPNRIGIVRDASKPGRDFIAFTLGSDSSAWRLGYKRMDIARATAPDTYNLRYYHNDFAFSDTAVRLDHDRHFQ
ncbi:MAG TPA: membrane lipoprotein lipid attachment site-containing protein, partial [Verrucomicrobiae bacterium]